MSQKEGLQRAIHELIEKRDLSAELMTDAMTEIMHGNASNAQMGAFLVALRLKGETVDEIAAAADLFRQKAEIIKAEGEILDIVGTGGDKSNSFNVSTITAIVVAAAGYSVAKHGNRSVSSKCGSADLLEALGVKIDVPVEKNQRIFDTIGLCFMFAPIYHSSMKNVAGVRRELGVRTIFNILGPLLNPAGAKLMLLGVYEKALVRPMAEVLQKLGVQRGMVVWGHDGLDEVTLCSKTDVCEINGREISCYEFNPAEQGFDICNSSDLTGGDPQQNAKIALDLLNGEKGPMRDMVVLNSALSLKIANPRLTIEEAKMVAEETIDGGKALQKLRELIKLSNSEDKSNSEGEK